eukprot:2262501-Alexandrium_andersonii.AAC.1
MASWLRAPEPVFGNAALEKTRAGLWKRGAPLYKEFAKTFNFVRNEIECARRNETTRFYGDEALCAKVPACCPESL